MNEDLRYLERLISKNEQKSMREHLSNELLANFIDGKLDKKEKDDVLEHLLSCDMCSDIVASTAPKRTSTKIFNIIKNRNFSTFMALAASAMLIVFVLLPTDERSLGTIDLSLDQYTQYKSPNDTQELKRKIDADSHLRKIIATTDMSGIEAYVEAEKYEKDALYRQAREKYKEAYMAIRHYEDAKERMKQKIVINYRLMQLAFKEQTQTDKSIEEYKDLLKYEIGMYAIRYGKN